MPTANMNLTLPTDHGSTDVWDTILDAVFNAIDQHDHTTGKGVKVPTAALNINADLSFAGAYALTDAKALDFSAVAVGAVAGYAGALFVNSADNELYWRTIAGTNVKVTAGNALNVAAFTGGIGGDYAAVGALFSFDDATDRYLAQQQGAPRPWAGIALGNLDIYEQAASISNRVRQKSPGGLAASYDMTWFTALPASVMGVAVDNAGQFTAGASFGMLANANITLSGSGSFKHATKTTSETAKFAFVTASAGSATNTGGLPGFALANNSTIYYPVPAVPQHARILNVSVYFNSAADRNACTVLLYQTDNSDPAARTFTSTGFTLTPSGTAISKVTGCNVQATGSRQYWVQISNSATTPVVVGIAVDWDIP